MTKKMEKKKHSDLRSSCRLFVCPVWMSLDRTIELWNQPSMSNHTIPYQTKSNQNIPCHSKTYEIISPCDMCQYLFGIERFGYLTINGWRKVTRLWTRHPINRLSSIWPISQLCLCAEWNNDDVIHANYSN